MRKSAILAVSLLALPLAACLTPARDFHGYIPDEVQPYDIKPGEDTRSSVTAQLGSPSTKGLFDTNTWFYISDVQERLAARVQELDLEIHEDEFQYWRRQGKQGTKPRG
jgi:outer membrane protein assembly factor BamE (lipoprotein component of BamABCDE complex)